MGASLIRFTSLFLLWESCIVRPFLDYISLWIALPLFILISYYIFISRRSPIIPIIAAAFLLVAFTALFGGSIHSIFRYYLVPVYALLLGASFTRRSLIIVSSITVLSLFLPSGSFQLLPPLFCILILLIYLYKENAKPANPLSMQIASWSPPT